MKKSERFSMWPKNKRANRLFDAIKLLVEEYNQDANTESCVFILTCIPKRGKPIPYCYWAVKTHEKMQQTIDTLFNEFLAIFYVLQKRTGLGPHGINFEKMRKNK